MNDPINQENLETDALISRDACEIDERKNSYEFWLSPNEAWTHLEDNRRFEVERSTSKFKCRICSANVWRESNALTDKHWFWCRCITACFPTDVRVPETARDWSNLIWGLCGGG